MSENRSIHSGGGDLERLALSANAAAIEVDRLIRDQDYDPQPISEVSSLLSQAFQPEVTAQGATAVENASTAVVVHQAFRHTGDGQSLTAVKDVAERTQDLVKEVAHILARETMDLKSLEGIRDFFVAVSRAASDLLDPVSKPEPIELT